MPEMKDGCVKPARGPIPRPGSPGTGSATETRQEGGTMLNGATARVGETAPDFEANAFVGEAGFKTMKLSDYKGRWIVLCFYPGDFTFV
jgi:hypothetical protein